MYSVKVICFELDSWIIFVLQLVIINVKAPYLACVAFFILEVCGLEVERMTPESVLPIGMPLNPITRAMVVIFTRHREMRWVSLEGKPRLEKMTSEHTCLIHVHGIVERETPNVRNLSFCNLDCFQSELDFGKTFWTATNRQRMSLNGWSMGWMSKKLLSPLRYHL